MKDFQEKIGDRLFTAQAGAHLEEEVAILFQGLRDLEPSLLKNHFAFQVGISIFFLKELEEGDFLILSVNYDKNPLLNLTQDLTWALEMERDKRTFMETLALKEEDSRFDDRVMVARDAFSQGRFSVRRKEETYSAEEEWDILRLDGKNEDFFALYVYQVLKEFPDLAKVMGLPFEYSALVEAGQVTEVWDDKKKIVWKK